MSVLTLTMIFAVLIILVLTLLLFRQQGCKRKFKIKLEQLEKKLSLAEQKSESFSRDLVAAERNKKELKAPQSQGLPDRYRYLTGMAEQGMTASQIAGVLQMGEAEVAQIVRLVLLKKDG